MSPSDPTNIGLKDLVVGEPAIQEALDAEAAKRKAEAFAREVAADPGLAEAIERAGGKVDVPVASPPRITQPIEARATAPRLAATLPPATEPGASTEGAERRPTTMAPVPSSSEPTASIELVGVVHEPARSSAEPPPPREGRRHVVLATVTLGVAILLLGLVFARGGSSPESSPSPREASSTAKEGIHPAPTTSPSIAATAPSVTANAIEPVPPPSHTSDPVAAPSIEVPTAQPPATSARPPRPPTASARPAAPPSTSSDRPF